METPKQELITQDIEESVALEDAKKKNEEEKRKKQEAEKKRKEEEEKEKLKEVETDLFCDFSEPMQETLREWLKYCYCQAKLGQFWQIIFPHNC